MVLSRCSMTDITAKLFCSQVRKRCTKHSTWHLPSSCECVTTALICQLLPRLPKNSDICSLWCCSRYFIAQSMIIRHIFSSSWVRAFCFAYSWLTERSKCAFQAWTAGEHSLCSKFILALVSSLMTKSSIFFSMSQKFESRESHLSQWMSGSLKACKVQWSLLCSFLPLCVLQSVFKYLFASFKRRRIISAQCSPTPFSTKVSTIARRLSNASVPSAVMLSSPWRDLCIDAEQMSSILNRERVPAGSNCCSLQ